MMKNLVISNLMIVVLTNHTLLYNYHPVISPIYIAVFNAYALANATETTADVFDNDASLRT